MLKMCIRDRYLGFAGLDLAKKVMQIHFVTEDGEITDKSAKRAEFLDFFRNRGKCLIGMEADVYKRQSQC